MLRSVGAPSTSSCHRRRQQTPFWTLDPYCKAVRGADRPEEHLPCDLGWTWQEPRRRRTSISLLLRRQRTEAPGAAGRSSGLSDRDEVSNGNGDQQSAKKPVLAIIDPYQAAGQRLQALLAGVGDGEEELLNSMLMNETVEFKVTSALVAGGLISGLACVFCWVAGLDPLGGASLSKDSFHAAVVGGAASLPLVVLRVLLWSNGARRQFPFLEEILMRQIADFEPVLNRLSPVQTLAILGSEVIPAILLLLPTSVGGIQKLLEWYGEQAGFEPTPYVTSTIAISITALVAAISRGVTLMPGEQEELIIKDALDNADRYYRLMGVNANSPSGPSPATEEEALRAAEAFKAVAVTWLTRKSLAARWDAALASLEVMYLGCLWQITGDLAAPLTAAIASAAVDFAAVRRRISS